MRSKSYIWFGALLLLSLFSISFISADGIGPLTDANFTYSIPANDNGYNTLNGYKVINVSVVNGTGSGGCNAGAALTGAGACNNYSRVWAYIKSAGATANTTLTLINGSLNFNPNLIGGNISVSINTTWFEDGADYNLTLSWFNGTNYWNVSRTIVIDNAGVPAPTLTPANRFEINSATNRTFNGSVGDANTTSCTATIARGGASSGSDYFTPTPTYSAADCSFYKNFASSLDNGEWYFKITASDGTNTTASTTNIVLVNIPGSSGGLPYEADYDEEDTSTPGSFSNVNSSTWIIVTVIIIAILVVLWLIFM